MKNFKSFIQLDEVERVKYKDGIANKMAYATDEVKTKGNRLDNKQAFGEEVPSHQSKTTMKHISNPNAAEKKAAKDIKPGVKGYQDRVAMLKAAKARGALKNEDVELLSDLYDKLDESNKEIFLNQLEEDAEVLLAFAKTIAEE
jgi:uncharacterized membrane protein YfhO